MRRVLVLGLLLLVPVAPPRVALGQEVGLKGGFLELTSVFFGEGGRTFGPGEIITVTGEIPFLHSKIVKTDGVGALVAERLISVFPIADLYVVPDGIGKGAKLVDVSGTPNRVFGTAGGGAFVEQIVAITKPEGTLGNGRYDIVMDLGADGVYDPSVDIILGRGLGYAFEVVIPDENLYSIPLSPIKEIAGDCAYLYDSAAAILDAVDQVQTLYGKGSKIGGCASLGSALAIAKCFAKLVFGEKFNEAVEKAWSALPVPVNLNPISVFVKVLRDVALHYRGIAADPPDPDYRRFAALGPIPMPFTSGELPPIEASFRLLMSVLTEQASILEAFRITLERYQGALDAGDHEYVVLQLRHLRKLTNLLAGSGGNLLRSYAALEAFDLALQDPYFGGGEEPAELRSVLPGLRRALGVQMRTLIGDFKRVQYTGGEMLVPEGLLPWIEVYLGEHPYLSEPNLRSIFQVRAAKGLPPLVLHHPTAMSTGPYTAPPGRTIHLDASRSTDPDGDPLTFAWDFDGDGEFDDGSAVEVDRVFDERGTRLVGLKVTDPAGNVDLHYVLVKIGDLTRQDVVASDNRDKMLRITPEGAITTLRPGLSSNWRTPYALHVDLNGDVWDLQSTGGPEVLRHFDAAGNPLGTITRDEIGALLGIRLRQLRDFVIDGRGDILLLAHEAIGPGQLRDLPNARTTPFDVTHGRGKLLRLKKDASAAWFIADVDQWYESIEVAGGVPTVTIDSPYMRVNDMRLAIDPEGNVLVAYVRPPGRSDSDMPLAVVRVDPVTGAVTEVVRNPNFYVAAGEHQLLVGLATGGASWGVGFGAGNSGIEVDDRGNFYAGVGYNGFNPHLYRVPMPPQTTLIPGVGYDSLLLEVVPVHLGLAGGPSLLTPDFAIDAGGDLVACGGDSNRIFSVAGLFRISPAGEVFQVANTLEPSGFGTMSTLDVVPSVRRVTVKDLLPPPPLRLHDMTVDETGCPDYVDVGVQLTNDGTTAFEERLLVTFCDGDPVAGGVEFASVEADPALAPGATRTLTARLDAPMPGPHEIFAVAAGLRTHARAFSLCLPADPPNPLSLSPGGADKVVGETHRVVATIQDILGNPVGGVTLQFKVEGVNAAEGEAVTDADGRAAFEYAGLRAGEDSISASDPREIVSAAVSARWALPLLPQAPIADLQARAKDATVSLVWTPVPGAVSYDVFRSQGGSGFTLVKTGLVTSYATYLDTGLVNGVTYSYLVRWRDAAGRLSPDSNIASATPVSARGTRR